LKGDQKRRNLSVSPVSYPRTTGGSGGHIWTIFIVRRPSRRREVMKKRGLQGREPSECFHLFFHAPSGGEEGEHGKRGCVNFITPQSTKKKGRRGWKTVKHGGRKSSPRGSNGYLKGGGGTSAAQVSLPTSDVREGGTHGDPGPSRNRNSQNGGKGESRTMTCMTDWGDQERE